MKIKYLKIKVINNKKGNLGIIQYKDLPFKIRRTYFINNMPLNIKRSGHAHKKLNQLLVCLNGKIRIDLSDGKNNKSIIL